MKTPVVLAHGFLATEHVLWPMARRLRSEGLSTHVTPELSFLALAEIETLSEQLDAAVSRVRRQTGSERVDVVGVSLGGIIGLHWALKGGDRHLRRLVTMGAPVRGTWATLVGVPLVGAFSPGLWQMMPGSDFISELGSSATGLDVHTISVSPDVVAPPARCHIDDAVNTVVRPRLGILNHQAMGFSGRVHRALMTALES
jgi:pimeloyl-ACP methyl ester carboxylesterase